MPRLAGRRRRRRPERGGRPRPPCPAGRGWPRRGRDARAARGREVAGMIAGRNGRAEAVPAGSGAEALNELFWRSEILQALYWMGGGGGGAAWGGRERG